MTVKIDGISLVYLECTLVGFKNNKLLIHTTEGDVKDVEPGNTKEVRVYDFGVQREHFISDGKQFQRAK